MIKKKLILTSILIIGIGVIYYNLPVEIKRKSDIKRGNELVAKILEYKEKYGKLPEHKNWKLLKSIGFTEYELERAYPEYYRINDSKFQLIFIDGFDPPYLLWESDKRKWDNKFPKY